MQEHAVLCSIMQSESDRIRECLRKNGWSQALLAAKAGVHQSTVSRALEGITERHSKARHRLALYVEGQESTDQGPKDGGAKRVINAFNKIWDGSDTHATSIAKIIGALAGLRPTASTEKRGRVGQRQSTQKAAKKRRLK
jgi:transcriptional regulator with XRE-family HTH domain